MTTEHDAPNDQASPSEPDQPSMTVFDAFVSAVPRALAEQADRLAALGAGMSTGWAIAIALRDFVAATGAAGVGEEHRTSVLMGCLGISLGVFQRLGEISGLETEERFLWHAARKHTSQIHGPGESLVGADFGVALPIDGARYKLSLFQAKNRVTEGKLDLKRPPNKEDVPNWKDLKALADIRLANWAMGVALTDPYRQTRDHQMFKLATTQALGRIAANPGGKPSEDSWVHYVAWSDGEPVCFPLDSCILNPAMRHGLRPAEEHHAEIIDLITAVELADKADVGSSLAEHLANGLSERGNGWIELSEEEARRIVGEFVELGVDWYVVDGRSGSRVHRLASEAKEVSALTSTKAVATADLVKGVNPRGYARKKL